MIWCQNYLYALDSLTICVDYNLDHTIYSHCGISFDFFFLVIPQLQVLQKLHLYPRNSQVNSLALFSEDTLMSTLIKSYTFLRLQETHASLFGNLDFQIGLLLLFFTLNFWLFADYSLGFVSASLRGRQKVKQQIQIQKQSTTIWRMQTN